MKQMIVLIVGLGGMALDAPVHYWYVTTPIVVMALSGLVWLVRTRARFALATRLLLWLIPIFWLLILVMGAVFNADPAGGAKPEDTLAPVRGLVAVGGIGLLTCLSCVALARGQRLAAASFALLGLWIGCWFYFVAAMSVSGVWL